MPYFDQIEWEYLKKEKVYELHQYSLNSNYELPNIKKIIVRRSSKYKIVGTIIGKFSDANDLKQISDCHDVKKFVNFELKNDYEIISIEKCLFGGVKHDIINNEYELKLDIGNVTNEFKNSSEISWYNEWYINGPKNSPYCRFTEYSKGICYKKIRKTDSSMTGCVGIEDYEKDFKFKQPVLGSFRRNYLLVTPKKCPNFIISDVPKNYGPEWSKKLSIEYPTSEIIDEKIRNKISEISSFMFGRKLIKVGETYFDKEGNVIKSVSSDIQLSSKMDISKMCELPDSRPIANDIMNYEIEKNLSFLVDSYLSISQKLDFFNFFIYYWDSSQSPSETESIILSSALESLVNTWYKSEGSNSKGVFMTESEFNKIAEKELKSLEDKFSGFPGVLARIKSANQMGITKKVMNFFEEIDLKIGNVEKKAINIRHKAAHGSKITEETFKKMIILNPAYRTLINRAILKILKYSGHYFDNYSNSVIKDINMPIQEVDENKLITILE
jgi:hypothetical protein